jgi:hypothetical protein
MRLGDINVEIARHALHHSTLSAPRRRSNPLPHPAAVRRAINVGTRSTDHRISTKRRVLNTDVEAFERRQSAPRSSSARTGA